MDPENPEQLTAVTTEFNNLKALYQGWLTKMDEEVKAAPESAREAIQQRQSIGKANVENQLKFLNTVMASYLTQVESCKADPGCWAKVLPTDERAQRYMRNHRLQRGVIEAAKRCKAEAEKASCLSKGVPSAAKADDLAAAYDAIAKTFARSDDPQIPGKIREDKVLAVSTFLVDTAIFLQGRCEMLGRYASE